MNRHDGKRPENCGPLGMEPASARGETEVNDQSGSQLMLSLPRGIREMRAAEASQVNENHDPAVGESSAPMEWQERSGEPFGQRLVAARERHGWSRAEVATRLKLPVKLVARLEGNDYTGLTEGVFLRGYLGSYARLVGIPLEQAVHVAAAHTHAAPLVATGTISRSRYLFERYSVSATYLVLTAIIVVPAVWLATHGGLEQNLARTTPLDRPVAITVPARTADGGAAAADTQVPMDATATDALAASAVNEKPAQAVEPTAVDQPPVIASMAPFPSGASAVAPSGSQPPAAAIDGGAHTLEIRLNQPSWVEVTTADGRKLEYSILAAGSEHSYRSDGPLSFRLGNVHGAEVRTDGSVIDLTPFQHGNVAHVRLFSGTGAGISRIDQ